MHTHRIILSSSYVRGTRIVLDFVDCDFDKVSEALAYVYDVCGSDTCLATHCLITESESWQSVVESDPYWEGACLIPTVEEFAKLIKESRALPARDVAAYVLTQVPCSEESLTELVHRLYEQYLPKKLFDDQGESLSTGTPIKTSGNGLALRSRILFSYDGIGRVFFIDKALKEVL